MILDIIILMAGGLVGMVTTNFFGKNESRIKLLLAFSGSFLLTLCIIHMLPEIYESHPTHIGLFVLLGFFLQLLLDFFSQGIEHGHLHVHNDKKGGFPLLMLTSLCLHAFIEATPIHIGHETAHGSESLLWGIALHKIPISIILMVLLLNANLSKWQIVLSMVLFAGMAPLGLFTGEQLVTHLPIEHLEQYILAIASGVILHISTIILFESSHNHRFHLLKFGSILVGAAAAIIIF